MTPSELKKHRLLSDNEDHFLVRSHDGVEFKVAKNGLKASTINRICKLEKEEPVQMNSGGEVPCYSDGGVVYANEGVEVPDPTKPRPSDFAVQADMADLARINEEKAAANALAAEQESQRAADYQSMITPEAPTTPALNRQSQTLYEEPAGPQAAPKEIVSAPQQQPAPMQPMGPQKPTPEQEARSIADNLIRQTEIATKAAIDAKMAGARALQETNEKIRLNEAEMMDSFDSMKNEILSEKIDPNRLWTNMSTGNKILASLSILLGGAAAGGGGGGGKNMALESMKDAMEKDIDAQKANIGNKVTLLSKNLEKYRNMNEALNATRAGQLAVVEALVSANLSKIANPQAQMAAFNFLSGVRQEQAKLVKNVSEMYVLEELRNGRLSPNMYTSVPEGFRKDVVPGPNGLGLAIEGSGQKMRDAYSTYKEGMDLIKDITSAIASGPALPLTAKNDLAEALKARTTLMIKDTKKLGQLSGGDQALVNAVNANPASFLTSKQIPKLNQLERIFKSAFESTAKGNMVNYQEPVTPTEAPKEMKPNK